LTGFEQPPYITVVCAVIERAGRVLAAKRGTGKLRGGQWEFPGGKMQAGETAEHAVVREVREERGCVVRPRWRLSRIQHRYPDIAVTLLPFVCALLEGTPRALEHAELRWVVYADVCALDWSEADVPIAIEYFAATR